MSLRLRLMLSIIVVMLATLALGSGLGGWHAARRVRIELDAALATGRATAARALQEAAAQADPPGAADRRGGADILGAFDGSRHLRAMLTDASGAPGPQSRLRRPDNPAPAWFRALVRPDLAPVVLPVPGRDPGTRLLLLPDPRNEASEAWTDLRDSLFVLLAFCLGAALLVYATVSRALRPLHPLRQALQRLGGGAYGTELPVAGPPELAALALGFNRMSAQLAQAEAQNQRLHAQLQTIQDEERADIARDLHDEIGPALFAMRMDLAALRQQAARGDLPGATTHAAALQDALGAIQSSVRDILRRLRPAAVTEFGLCQAVRDLVGFWHGRHPAIAFAVDLPEEDDDLDPALAEAAYRIVQEGLSNALRHAGARHIRVALRREPAGLVASVADDGATGAAPAPGFGLAGMRERVAAVGGALTLDHGEGRGWTVTARLPCPARPLADA